MVTMMLEKDISSNVDLGEAGRPESIKAPDAKDDELERRKTIEAAKAKDDEASAMRASRLPIRRVASESSPYQAFKIFGNPDFHHITRKRRRENIVSRFLLPLSNTFLRGANEANPCPLRARPSDLLCERRGDTRKQPMIRTS